MISLIVFIVIIGVIMYLINAVIPMEGNIKMILNVVVAIAVLIYALQSLGLLHGGPVLR